jgi:hypothetical protein
MSRIMGAAVYFLKNKDAGNVKLTSCLCLVSSDTFARPTTRYNESSVRSVHVEINLFAVHKTDDSVEQRNS